MTQFEYLSVLISIVLALGISETLVCWVRLVQHREQVHFSWLHGYWTLVSVYLMIQFWWGFWNYRLVEPWTLFGLFTIVLETMLVVTIAMFLSPGRTVVPGLDLEQHFFRNSRIVFIAGALMILLAVRADTTLLGIEMLAPENLVRLTGAALALVLAFTGSSRFHYGLAMTSILLLTVFSITAVYL